MAAVCLGPGCALCGHKLGLKDCVAVRGVTTPANNNELMTHPGPLQPLHRPGVVGAVEGKYRTFSNAGSRCRFY